MVCTCTSESTPRPQPQGLALVQVREEEIWAKLKGQAPSQSAALPPPVLQSKALHGSTLDTSTGPWAMHKHPWGQERADQWSGLLLTHFQPHTMAEPQRREEG